MSKTEEFIGHVYGYFKRRYAPKVDLSEAEAQIINSLQDCYLDVLKTNESHIDEKFLKNKEEAIITSKIRESLGVGKAEAARCLPVVVAVTTLLQRHGFFQSSFNPKLIVDSDPKSSDLIPNRNTIFKEFSDWLAEDRDRTGIDAEEKARLARFYHVIQILFNLFGTANQLKGMFLFVGACLEGVPDQNARLYKFGSKRSKLTQRRERIIERITGVGQRLVCRGSKSEEVRHDDQEDQSKSKKKRKRINSSSTQSGFKEETELVSFLKETFTPTDIDSNEEELEDLQYDDIFDEEEDSPNKKERK